MILINNNYHCRRERKRWKKERRKKKEERWRMNSGTQWMNEWMNEQTKTGGQQKCMTIHNQFIFFTNKLIYNVIESKIVVPFVPLLLCRCIGSIDAKWSVVIQRRKWK